MACSELLNELFSCRRSSGKEYKIYNHVSSCGYRPDEVWNMDKNEPEPGWYYRSWCPSGDTSKPESGWGKNAWTISVMLGKMGADTDDDQDLWLHIIVKDEIELIGKELSRSPGSVRGAFWPVTDG